MISGMARWYETLRFANELGHARLGAMKERAGDSGWSAVFAEFEDQLNFGHLVDAPSERRNRTTMQCQRLLRSHYVALAVPVTSIPQPGIDDRKGPHVVAFTNEGPWLFSSSRSNIGLPREPIGLIPDPSPMSFGPHEREGGVLTIGVRVFLVPYLYAQKVRDLIISLGDA